MWKVEVQENAMLLINTLFCHFSALQPDSRRVYLSCGLLLISPNRVWWQHSCHSLSRRSTICCSLPPCLPHTANPIQTCTKQSDRETVDMSDLRLNLWVRFPLLLAGILANRFWRWACWLVSPSICNATALQGKISSSVKEWKWWQGYNIMIFLLLSK